MKELVTTLALKIIPEEGKLREFAKRVYRKIHPPKPDVIHMQLPQSEQTRLNDAVRIGFIGDLILLRDMVEAGKADGEYNYGAMFEPLKSYFSECDFMTGVLEGPLSGENLAYTTANYGDGRDLRCGYPDNFLEAVKEAGIDFVTVANNHLYDKGQEGMERTIARLESESMPYVGYGENARRLVEVKGLKIAVLAYTYGFNGKKENFFFEAGNENLPHLIRPKGSKVYQQCLSQVKDDFEWAKVQNPDCIIVYPHIGEQFLHAPEQNQLHWFEIFKSLGADVILGCHSHATQPLRFEDGTLCLYCPGNFVNNYFPYDGDASAMVEVYLDKSTGKPFAASIVPIWAYGNRHRLLCAMPMSEMAGNDELSWHEWLRLKDAQRVVTNSMLGVEVPIDQ